MRTWWIVGGFVVGAGVAGFLWGLNAGITAEAWAAWAQAFFSVAAIAAAVAIAQWQRKEDRNREDLRERSLAHCKMDMVASMAAKAVDLFDTEELQKRNWAGFVCAAENHDSAAVLQVFQALGQLGPADVVDGQSLIDVVDLRTAVVSIDALLTEVRHQGALRFQHDQAVEQARKINVLLDTIGAARVRLDAVRDRFVA